jgi:polysaccharide pyruvyl transferase WcaK-like protein
MIIEVCGTNTWNKGAELMLAAIRERLKHTRPNTRIAVDSAFGAYADRAKYELLYCPRIERWGRSKIASQLLPSSFRRQLGLVREAEIEALLDASGFAFGDQHPAARAEQFAKRVAAARKAARPAVLLPQALGPFERPDTRAAFARILESANLVFARDPISLEHAQGVLGADSRLRMAPDFTNLLKPPLNVETDLSPRVCIVPNQRMIEKARDQQAADAYLPLLRRCVDAAARRGLAPALLVHGTHDAELAQRLNMQLDEALPMIRETDPLRIKQILGESHLVIASRFHALVSALAQGVPAIGTSWSHKYEMLFADYGCPSLLLPVEAGEDQISEALEHTAGAGRAALRHTLLENGERLRAQVELMWRAAEALLLDRSPRAAPIAAMT